MIADTCYCEIVVTAVVSEKLPTHMCCVMKFLTHDIKLDSVECSADNIGKFYLHNLLLVSLL